MTITRSARLSSRTALALMQLGILTRQDWVKPWAHESVLIGRSLTRWMRQATRELEIFRFRIVYSENRASELNAHFGWDYDPFPSTEDDQASFTIGRLEETPHFSIGEGIIDLEHAVPGLGETVCWALHEVYRDAVPVGLPSSVFWFARHVYWEGMTDETHAARARAAMMARQNPKDPDEVDIYRLTDFLSHIPAWAAMPEEQIRPSKLRQLAKDHAGTREGAVADLLLKLKPATKNIWSPDFEESDDLSCADLAAIFRWSEDDDCIRIADDARQHVYNQNQSTDDFGTAYFDPNPESIKDWLRRAERLFKLLRLFEQIVLLIGKPLPY